MNEILKQQIGASVREARRRSKLTQEQLADKIKKSEEAVSNIERGLALPTLATLIDIAQTLEVSLSALVGDSSGESKRSPKRLALEVRLQSVTFDLSDQALDLAIEIVSVLGKRKI